MSKQALLEIGTEHLPARFMKPALSQLKTLTENILNEKRLTFERVETLGTFRKLVVFVHGLAEKSADIQKEVKGPPAKLLKDANGHFTLQSAGFAQKNGISPEKLVTVETDKGPFIYARVQIKGEKTDKLLPEIFTRIVTGLEFAKNMVWEETGLRYGLDERLLHLVAVDRAAVPAVGEALESPPQEPLGRHRADLLVIEADVDHVRSLGILVEPHDGQPSRRHEVHCLPFVHVG